jgi:hypothetical protein
MFALRMLLTIGSCLCATIASACPFCNVVGRPLAQQRDEAAVVAIAESLAAAFAGDDGLLQQPWRIDQVIRGRPDLGGSVVTARVGASAEGSGVLFGEGIAGEPLRWTAVVADEAVLGYVVAVPAWDAPPAERLAWFARRLEHPDPVIAQDAYTEFGLAPFAAVRAAAAALDAAKLTAWVAEQGIDQRRRGLYGLLLGLVASQAHDAMIRTAAISALHDAIEMPANDFRSGFDGLMGGVLVAEAVAGLDYLEGLGLSGPAGRPVDQRHLLSALRFGWEFLGAEIPRERISLATARLLAAPAVAADAVIDLARQQAWGDAGAVAALWESLGDDDPLVRRAVAGYLTACPLPEASRLLEHIRGRDPERLDAAIEAARLPR